MMGRTELESGSVWNTMPPHTHSRRSEIYLYYGLEDGVVIHLLGEPDQTRHVIAARSAGGSLAVVVDPQRRGNPTVFVHLGNGRRKPGLPGHGPCANHVS